MKGGLKNSLDETSHTKGVVDNVATDVKKGSLKVKKIIPSFRSKSASRINVNIIEHSRMA